MSTPGSTVPVTMTMNTATTTVKIEPSSVSKRPHGMSFSSMPLSTTALCWKNSIHGAMVVPILAIRKKNSWPLNPPAKFGIRPWCRTSRTDGCTMKGAGDVDQVQGAEEQRQLLEGPISAVQDDDRHQHDDRGDGDPRRHAEDGERRRHADELGDQRQPVDDHQIEQREPAPERPETVEDRLRVTPLGDGAEPHGHLLNVVGDRDQNEQKPDQVVAVLGAGRRVGGDAARVVVGDHDDDARSGDDQVESDRLPSLAQGIIESRKKIHVIVLIYARRAIKEDTALASAMREVCKRRNAHAAALVTSTVTCDSALNCFKRARKKAQS